ncbi:hypothetical protein, partial [Escherichia coli]|uniref:hypothetical protein n=1 Tax=Escherichia coli TaxID=562 RepID=UPI003EDE845C
AFFLNVSQFRRLTVVCFAGSLLKETGMVNPPVRMGNQRVGIWGAKKKECAIAQYGNVRVLSTG